jgi:hypothetical protein
MVGASLAKITKFPRSRVRGALSTTLGTKVYAARLRIMCKQVRHPFSYTKSPACYVTFLWQRPIPLFKDFYVRNSSQIRNKQNSVVLWCPNCSHKMPHLLT